VMTDSAGLVKFAKLGNVAALREMLTHGPDTARVVVVSTGTTSWRWKQCCLEISWQIFFVCFSCSAASQTTGLFASVTSNATAADAAAANGHVSVLELLHEHNASTIRGGPGVSERRRRRVCDPSGRDGGHEHDVRVLKPLPPDTRSETIRP